MLPFWHSHGKSQALTQPSFLQFPSRVFRSLHLRSHELGLSFFDSLLHTWAVIWSLSTTYCPIPVMRSVSLSAVLWMFSLYRAWSHENITAPSGSSGIDRVMGVRKSWFSTVLTWPPTPPFHPLFQPHGLSFLSPHHFPLHLFQQQTLYQEFSSGNMKKETDS